MIMTLRIVVSRPISAATTSFYTDAIVSASPHRRPSCPPVLSNCRGRRRGEPVAQGVWLAEVGCVERAGETGIRPR